MAIYHLSVKAVSRSAGRSSTGAAAYRAGEKIVDERTGEIHDYTRKGGVEHSEIVMPEGATWTPNRSELWNAAEQAEKRKDACVAREHEVALPKELTDEQRLELVRTYAQDLANRHGCVVDFAIHAPHKDRGGEDNENHHAHVLCTTRQVAGDELGAKCVREQAGQKRAADLEMERSTWAAHQNTALERHGHAERVDHRSLEAQGIEREPTVHKGPAVTAMERRGIQTEVSQRLAEAQRQGRVERAMAQAFENTIAMHASALAEAIKERDRPKTAEAPAPVSPAPEPSLQELQAKFGGAKMASECSAKLFLGNIVAATSEYVVQHRGRDEYVVHRRADLEKDLSYRDGNGKAEKQDALVPGNLLRKDYSTGSLLAGGAVVTEKREAFKQHERARGKDLDLGR